MIVSAFATRGLSADVMRLVLAEHELVVSTIVLEETERILLGKLRVPRPIVEEVLDLLRDHPIEPTPQAPPNSPVRDPDDARVLASALAADADVFVTGDHDFLDLADRVEGITITNPRGFWEMHRT